MLNGVYVYHCKSNDNVISVQISEGLIKELMFRMPTDLAGGVVIGLEDLNNAINEATE